MPSLRPLLLASILTLAFSSVSVAQVTGVNDQTATPEAGIGHDYIHMLDETVNPANGGVSLRIQVPIPKSRGLTLPFSFAYNSGGFWAPGSDPNGFAYFGYSDNATLEGQNNGGWAYSLPILSFTAAYTGGGYQAPVNQLCPENTGFTFQSPGGGQYSLGLLTRDTSYPGYLSMYPCGKGTSPGILTGGTDFYSAQIVYDSQTGEGFDQPVLVSDADSTVYTFPAVGTARCRVTPNGGEAYSGQLVASSVEDRNGNIVQFSQPSSCTGGFTETDSAGRVALSASGFGSSGNTVTVSGLAQPYVVTWGTSPVNTALNSTLQNNPTGACPNSILNDKGSVSVITGITLPNNQQYKFSYDSTSGLLSKITYPTGGYVSYTWAPNTQSEFAALVDTGGNSQACPFTYDTYAVQQRSVSYDGSTVALQQNFTYYTTWNSSYSAWTQKITYVTTHDLVSGITYTTQYKYSPMNAPSIPDIYSNYATQIPMEQTVTYEDQGGITLRTVNESWKDLYELGTQQVTLESGQTSEVAFSYGSMGQVTEKDEYDYGQSSPTRKTLTSYQPSPADRPCKVITEDGSGNAVAETDFLYDGATSPCSEGTAPTQSASTPTGTHDETNYGPSSTAARGNVTEIIRKCLSGCSQDAITTYTYDETGQVMSMTAPCGNATCSDMSGSSHTTTYSYGDSYGSCGGNAPPNGNTNAYLTLVTDPLGYKAKYCYGYDDGQLRGSIDENNQTNSYKYNTPPSGCTDGLDRLGEVDDPDGGKTTYCYNDTVPSVTTTTLIASGLPRTSVDTMDGMGRKIESALTSDNDGTDYTVTLYDGEGQVYKAYNPTRCTPPSPPSITNPPSNCGESSWGYKTYTYDALGRTTQVTDQDGSQISTFYSGNETTVTDEALHQRSSFTDGLGRLIDVDEPGATDATPGTGSVTFYASGGIQTYTFNPCAGNQYPAPQYCPQTEYDNGTIALMVDGQTFTINYTGFASSDASAMASTINQSSSYVFGRASGGTVYLIARTAGASTNYSLSCCTYTWNTGSYNGTSFFSGPSDTASASGSSLTGGTGANASPAVTQYTYDTLNDLVSVTQQGGADSSLWRVRTFNYDSLARLTCSSNPENSSVACPASPSGSYTPGTVGYTYDPDGNVTTKTDARDITTTYSYDALNRIYEKQYSDGTHSVTYGYDGVAGPGNCAPTLSTGNESIGKRTSMCDAAGNESWSYSIISGTGLQTTDKRTTNGIAKTTTTQDDLGGSLYQLTYPLTGRMVTYAPNGAGLPTSAADSSATYATGAHYTAAGALAYLQTGPNLYTTSIYNSRLQPCWIYANTGSALNWTGTSCSSSTTAGNVMDLKYNFNLGQSDNGNVMGVTNDRDSTRSQVFTYDTLNRLQTAGTANTSGTNCWDEQYAYDAWANLTSLSPQASYSTSCAYENPFTYTMNVKNQVASPSGFGYDASGNVTDSTAYAYNAESEMTSTAGYTYIYDGDGRRVEKIFGGSVVKIYWYGGGSIPLDETDGSGSTTNSTFSEYVFFAGARIARRDASGDVFYYVADHLGSARAIAEVASGQNTATLCYDADFYPFGGEMPFTDSCQQNYKFTGKERDSESGLDDFGARFFNSGSVLATTPFGRFTSPDPSNALVLRAICPQRWNSYAYAVDNPLSYTDPTGKDAAAVNFESMVGRQGHEALLIIDKDGTTTFASFGPSSHGWSNDFGSNGKGFLTVAQDTSTSTSLLPAVQFGANGLPTSDSYRKLVSALGKLEGVDPKTVRLNYFKTSEADTQALKTWVDQQRDFVNRLGTGSGFCWYNVAFSNCADFTVAGLFAGNALTTSQIQSLSAGFRPNSLFKELQMFETDEFDLIEAQTKQHWCVSAGGNTTCGYD